MFTKRIYAIVTLSPYTEKSVVTVGYSANLT